jgi:hypothetical protein
MLPTPYLLFSSLFYFARLVSMAVLPGISLSPGNKVDGCSEKSEESL